LKVDWSNDEQADFCALVARVVRTEHLQVLHAHYAVPFAHFAASVARRLGPSAPATIATLHGTDVSVHGRQPAERLLLTESLRALSAVTTVSNDHAGLASHLLAASPTSSSPSANVSTPSCGWWGMGRHCRLSERCFPRPTRQTQCGSSAPQPTSPRCCVRPIYC
jgi:hypothetical protein